MCRREVPVTLSDGDDAIIEGVADLVFEEAGAWVVVEFKTDVEIGKLGLERYRRQVGLYVAAIARATGKDTRGVLLTSQSSATRCPSLPSGTTCVSAARCCQAFHRDGPNDGASRPAEPVRPDECDVGPGEMTRPRLLGSGSGVMLSGR